MNGVFVKAVSCIDSYNLMIIYHISLLYRLTLITKITDNY